MEHPTDHPPSGADAARSVELALRRLGYARVTHSPGTPGLEPSFWVQEPGVPRRLFPVFIEGSATASGAEEIGRWVGPDPDRRAIVVVPNDGAADEAWRKIGAVDGQPIDADLAILVVPPTERPDTPAHWHARIASRAEILRLATGIVVGMFRRAQASGGSTQVDFEELLTTLRQRFGVDVHRSLGVRSDEDALFLIYQLALRYSYAPGDPASNLHVLVLKPTGPGARLPWFAA